MPTQITEIIPAGKKRLINTLTEAGLTTLEACAQAGPEKLLKYRGLGHKTLIALKEHCFKRGIKWSDSHSRIHKLSIHFMSRYKLSPKDAKLVATAFYWDNAYPTSLLHPMF